VFDESQAMFLQVEVLNDFRPEKSGIMGTGIISEAGENFFRSGCPANHIPLL
jgi:hypothetical protein